MSLLPSNIFQENSKIWRQVVKATIYTLLFTQLENIIIHSQLPLDNTCILYRVLLQSNKDR
jgi:hypothetical protein